ncbi:terminase small subunit [Escherichia coli]|uniref:terminase small subunit n=1 Tax=Escherichia coli TaxID=562 RepID=UPI000BF498DA|nr:terminase small subunit [Escherichia coli]EFN8403752.1 terminase [Escherichia coli O15]EHK9585110.1 terminase small subunit [Escherichia coli]EIN0513736.1 terminase small subunit [Escherichia coli]EIP3290409.1 terminase small subunit [Escherichia coli]EJI7577473.1 terminase small subunit [Escherichia coli]
MKSYLMNKKNMAQSCRVSATAFDKWGVTPVERKGREAFYDVASVIDNRVSNAINQITNDKGEIDDDQLLRVRIRLLTAQAEAQELKNERDRGDVIDTEFCMYALSKLASQISSIMDSLPLTMQRSFPQMTPAMLDGLKKEVVRACNACTKLDENIPRMLSDYLMETTGNVPDKFQPDKDK